MVQPEVRLAAVVAGKNGLHARPALQLAEVAQRFTSTIQIVKDDNAVDCKSVLQLLTLVAESGATLMVIARGADAADAASAIAEIIETEETATNP